MPVKEWNATTGLWAIRADDNSLISKSHNLLDPFNAPNGYVGYVKAGQDSRFGMTKLSTTLEVEAAPLRDAGGKIFSAVDSRYALMVQRISMGKQFDYFDAGAVIFDTLAGAFLDFDALGVPSINVVHDSGGQHNMLWVQNGRQIGAPWVGTDPPGKVRRITVTSTLIEYVLAQVNAGGQTIGFTRQQRSINLATGAMGTITETATHTVDVNSPSQPVWF